MIKTVILDDEIHSTETLAFFLEKKCEHIELSASFNDPMLAIEYLKENEIDLLILDIEMPRLNGFELLKLLQPLKFEVIFLTAYNEFAIEAFRYCAFDYFLKPIDELELAISINRLSEKLKSLKKDERLELLFELINPDSKRSQKIALPTREGYEFIELNQIVRIESDSNYSKLFLKSKKNMVVCKTLKEIEETLEGNNFIRVHNSHIVNTAHVRKYIKSGGGYLLTIDDFEVPISRFRKNYALSILNIK